MIEGYLNQGAVWKRKTGSNEYGEPVTKQKSIKVRWEGKRRLVRDNQGREVVSEARVFCVEAVKPGDELEFDGRRWPVIAVSCVPGLDGAENHREVAV
ncbi:MAG TPA: hypothetical protein GX530_06805 [Corynebacteriales bacterium]|nr:hypothetical protein [Mycobacteriales bacterium]